MHNSKTSNTFRACNNCKKLETIPRQFLTCGRCRGPRYCSVECQREEWKKSHKEACGQKFVTDQVDLNKWITNNIKLITPNLKIMFKAGHKHIVIKLDSKQETYELFKGNESLRSIYETAGTQDKYDQFFADKNACFIYVIEINTDATTNFVTYLN